jgi:hypothetical protein
MYFTTATKQRAQGKVTRNTKKKFFFVVSFLVPGSNPGPHACWKYQKFKSKEIQINNKILPYELTHTLSNSISRLQKAICRHLREEPVM